MNRMLPRLHCGARSCQSLFQPVLQKLGIISFGHAVQSRCLSTKRFRLLGRKYFSTAFSSSSIAVTNLNFDTVINPDLDAEQRFKDISKLEENARRRKINLDAKKLHSDYLQLMRLEKEITSLEQQRRENADLMKHIVKGKGEKLDIEKAELIRRGKTIRTKLKQLQDADYQMLYKRVASDILRLPLDLHHATLEEDVVVAESESKPEFSFPPINHLMLGQNMKSRNLRQKAGNTFYLLNEAALLEHHLLHRFAGDHLRQSGLQQIVCPDMVKAFVAEGCGFDLHELFEVAGKTPEEKSGTAEEGVGKSGDHSLVLAGVSTLGFAAYLSAMNIHKASLPLKYYSVGRSYSPVVDEEVGLYSASQASCAAVFGAAHSSVGAEKLYDEFSSLTLALYKSLNLPFRAVQVGASNLRLMEAKRTDFYVWSVGFNRYFKSGELRLCGDYISRRLSITSTEGDLSDNRDDTSNKFVHTVDGIIIKIPAIIAALMEHAQQQDGTSSLPLKFTTKVINSN